MPGAGAGDLVAAFGVLDEGEALAVGVGVEVGAVGAVVAAQVVVAVAGFFAEEAPVAAGSADGFDVDAVVVVQVGARWRVVRVDEEGGLAQDVVLVVVRFVVDGVIGGDAGDQGDEQGGEGEAGGKAQA